MTTVSGAGPYPSAQLTDRLPAVRGPFGLGTAKKGYLSVQQLVDMASATAEPPTTVGTLSDTADFLYGFSASLNSPVKVLAGNVAFTQAGAGAGPRPLRTKLQEIQLSVKDFFAVGDGVADDTAAIVAANAQAFASGKALFFPKGSYLISGPVTPSEGAYWIFENIATTRLVTSSATADVIVASNSFVTIENIWIAPNTGVIRSGTTGYYYNNTGNNNVLKNFYFAAPNRAIHFGATVVAARVADGIIDSTVATTGLSVLIEGAILSSFSNVRTTGGTHPANHIVVTKCGDLTFDEFCQLTSAAINFQVSPASGQEVDSIKCRAWLDQATSINLKITPTGTGAVSRCVFAGWAVGAVTANVSISGISGTVNGIDFSGMESKNSAYGYSMDASGGVAISNIQLTGGQIAGNSIYGLYAKGVNGLGIFGTRIGPTGGFGVNAIGVGLDGATDNVTIKANMQGNTIAFTNTASGTNIIIDAQTLGFDAILTPAQVTSDQNDYAPAGFHSANVLSISTDTLRNFTGFAAPAYAKTLLIYNSGAQPFVLQSSNTGSAAANRFAFAGDIAIPSAETILIKYLGSRWAQIGGAVMHAGNIVSGILAVARGGTGLASGTSGGILGYTAAGVLASSVLLTANALVLGAGAGATPTPLGSLGTATTVLHGAAAGPPTWGAVSLSADVSGTLQAAQFPTLTGDITTPGASLATTLASVISSGGPIGSATVAPIITWDAKGRLTTVSSATITPAVGSITGLGTGIATWLATPTSANLLAALTTKTGTGSAVFATSPTLSAPVITGGGSQNFIIGTRGAAVLTIQGQTTAQDTNVEIYNFDGTGANSVGFNMFGLGTPSALTNIEYMQTAWVAGSSEYQINTQKSGTGTVRPIHIYTGANAGIKLDAAGSFAVGASIATNAADGFIYIPTCAGTPTGAATSKAGLVPLIYDSTNNILYVNNGGWKQPKTVGTVLNVAWS